MQISLIQPTAGKNLNQLLYVKKCPINLISFSIPNSKKNIPEKAADNSNNNFIEFLIIPLSLLYLVQRANTKSPIILQNRNWNIKRLIIIRNKLAELIL